MKEKTGYLVGSMGCRKLAYYENQAAQLKVVPEETRPVVIIAYRIELENGNIVQGWFTVDPLAHQFPSWTPYHFVHGSPLMMIDPDGKAASPIYNFDGDFLGTDNEGFKGDIIIMNEGFEKGMNHDEAIAKGSLYDDTNLSDGAKSNILTDVVNQNLGDGLDFEKNNLRITMYNGSGYFNSDKASKNDMRILANGNNYIDGAFETTVENVRNAVLVHEIQGHVFLQNKFKTTSPSGHARIFQMQIDNPQFKSTTNDYKRYSLSMNYYLKSLSNQTLSNKDLKLFRQLNTNEYYNRYMLGK